MKANTEINSLMSTYMSASYEHRKPQHAVKSSVSAEHGKDRKEHKTA